MNQGRTVFSQLCQHPPSSSFHHCVEHYQAERYVKSFSCWDQFLCMAFAQCIKTYRAPREGEARYSPAEVASVEVVPVFGSPAPERLCTSIVERQNLTMRMQIRRLTPLTNAFSKKWEDLWAALCLHFAYYNFRRIHRTPRVTPAMEAGIVSSVCALRDFLSKRVAVGHALQRPRNANLVGYVHQAHDV